MLVTVYITTFNRMTLLKRAINSVLEQSYPHIEIIVADDGSTDGTHEYLKEMEDKGLLKSTINSTGTSKGACYGRNNAIAIANGHFITGLDDDDYFENWRISSFVNFWNEQIKRGVNFAGLFDNIIELRATDQVVICKTKKVSYSLLRKRNLIGNQIFTTRENFHSVNCFDEDMPAWQDWDTWIRLSYSFGVFLNINTKSYIVDQVHGCGRISEKKAKEIRRAHQRLVNKLSPLKWEERIALLDSLYNYKQIDVKFNDILILIFGFKFFKVAQIIKRLLYVKK